ncbi:MAG: YIP1 family protein [bacterium]|jgi:hypothetical protein
MSEITGAPAGPAPGEYWVRQNDIPPKMGFGAKLLNIFVEPSSVFKNIYYHNDWLTPFVVGGASMIVATLMQMGLMNEARRQFNEVMGIPGNAAVEGATTISQYVGAFFTPLNLLFIWLVGAAITFVLGTFLLENVDFKKLYSIVAWSWMPVIFTQLINGVYKMGQTPAISSYEDYIDSMFPWTLSLSQIISGDGVLFKVLGTIDVFAVWSFYLFVLGLIFGLHNQPGRAWTVALIYAAIGLAMTSGIFALMYVFKPPQG